MFAPSTEVLAGTDVDAPAPESEAKPPDQQSADDHGIERRPTASAEGDDRPLRLLHVHSGNLYGGVERLLETLLAHGNDLGEGTPGLRQDFALCFQGRLSERLRKRGAEVVDLGPVRRLAPWSGMRARRRLAAALRAATAAGDPYDVVLFHGFWSLGLLGGGAKAREKTSGGTPRALWLHEDPDASHWTYRRALGVGGDGVIFNSDFVHDRPASRALLEGLHVPGERGVVLRCPVTPPSPVTADRRAEARASLGVCDQETLIFIAARFVPWKGHALLMDALSLLAADSTIAERPWSCAIAGDAQLPAEKRRVAKLKTQAERLGIADRLRWLGHRDDMPEMMAAADVYCQPNTGPEPFGLVFVEALYAGCPVVTTATGGGREILKQRRAAGTGSGANRERGESAGLLTGIDATAVAKALRTLIVDPARRRRLGDLGPARAAALSDPTARLAQLDAFCRDLSGRSAPVSHHRPAAPQATRTAA
ncbi:glycosyltransferase family 4 protein [Alienimonas chondri]|uniref:D-inositol-3-phosphate glycosyltransferase n=1 Tax=Alienimonas chondri TaxID=2681879 RepID=A0ABX1VEE0_9PLAN|nr:glycosyltransferase family 4 protein [Alienimonas chondri]NNJ25880.1 D-inositol-3-phosphate glycosyltransferase [Alienimonas chondri]